MSSILVRANMSELLWQRTIKNQDYEYSRFFVDNVSVAK